MHVRRSLLVALTLGACNSPGPSAVSEARADVVAPGTTPAVAVVELFTSEGCSSCPPADTVLAELDRANATRSHSVFTLAFHVDYWDSLGWPDPFASKENTERQWAYARSFGASGVYTPQMVVDGVREFTGSDRGKAAESVARALAHPTGVALAIHPRTAGPNAVLVGYDVDGPVSGAVLSVAVVQRAASTDVRAGENKGRTLIHTNVVRAFVTTPIASLRGAEIKVPVPPALRHADGELIAIVQRAADEHGAMPILGATRGPLP